MFHVRVTVSTARERLRANVTESGSNSWEAVHTLHWIICLGFSAWHTLRATCTRRPPLWLSTRVLHTARARWRRSARMSWAEGTPTPPALRSRRTRDLQPSPARLQPSARCSTAPSPHPHHSSPRSWWVLAQTAETQARYDVYNHCKLLDTAGNSLCTQLKRVFQHQAILRVKTQTYVL